MSIRIATLGIPRIFRDETELTALPGKPLRCALLLYLAIERSATRDELIALFWGEKDPDKARHSLTQMMYELRQDLGNEWLESSGETFRTTDAVVVDIQEIEAAVEEGRFEDVVEECSGVFLEGVYLVDSREFEGWVDRWRSRLGKLRQKTFRHIVESRYEAGNLQGALAATRSWTECDALDDEAHHRLFQLLAESNQRSEALKEFERFSDRLQRELEVEPMEETVELIDQIRKGEHVSGQMQELVRPTSSPPPEHEPPPVPKPRRLSLLERLVQLFRRRLASLIIAAAIIGVIWWILPPIRPPLDPNKIVGFPLVDQRADVDEGVGIAAVLATGLEHTEPLKWIDGMHWLDEAQRRDPLTLSAEDARQIARARGAGFFLRGTIVPVSDSVSISLRLFDTRGDSLIVQRSAIGLLLETSTGQIALRALRGLLPSVLDQGRRADLRFLEEREPAAIALWIQGEREYRNNRFEPALEHYRNAVLADSLLAPAALKGAQAAGWDHRTGEAVELLFTALRHPEFLTPRQRLLAQGLGAYYLGQADSAVAYLNRATELDPQWSEAWTALGEVYYHLLPSDVEGEVTAVRALRQSLRHDSAFHPPLIHLIEHALRVGDTEDAERMIERFNEAEPDSSISYRLDLMLQCVRRGFSDEEWLEAAEVNMDAVFMSGKILSAGARQTECAEGALSAVYATKQVEHAAKRWGALMGLSGLLTAQGRHTAAEALLDSAYAAGEGSTPYLYLLGAVAGLETDEQSANADTLIRGIFGPLYRGTDPRTAWALGIWHAATGEIESLRSITESVTISARERELAFGHLMSEALSAHLALAGGDSAEALSMFHELTPISAKDTLEWFIADPLPVERIRLAQLHLDAGQYQEAYEVAQAFDHPGPIIFLYFIPESLSIRLAAAEAMGWTELASQHRARLEALGRTDLLDVATSHTRNGGDT